MHGDKQSTPTMGGLFVMAALWPPCCCSAIWNGYMAPAMVVAVGLALVGIVDDLVKFAAPANGISARHKLPGETGCRRRAGVLATGRAPPCPTGYCCAFPHGISFSLVLWFVPLAWL